jgi:hypothetical protein
LTAGLVGLLVLAGASIFAYEQSHPTDSSGASESAAVARSKADEIGDAQALHLTATRVAGNAKKWRGAYVRFPCRITNVIEGPAANAVCGRGVAATFHADMPANVDYTDPQAVAHAEAAAEKSAHEELEVMQDQAIVLLVGDRVKDFDGGQVVTISGQVLESEEGRTGLGVTRDFPTIRVDYAE